MLLQHDLQILEAYAKSPHTSFMHLEQWLTMMRLSLLFFDLSSTLGRKLVQDTLLEIV
jgi:hypothetical protein